MYIQDPSYVNGLDGFLSAEAIKSHSHHHHQYGKNLLKLIQNTTYDGLPLNGIIGMSAPNDTEYQTAKRSPVYNNAAQIRNHNLFFEQFSNSPSQITPEFKELLIEQFGSITKFREAIAQKSVSMFGSGWVWLALTYHTNWTSPSLRIISTRDGDTIIPLRNKEYVTHPLFVIDMWEHAYYPDFSYDRKQYIQNMWEHIDWAVVEHRYHSIITTITDYTKSFEL